MAGTFTVTAALRDAANAAAVEQMFGRGIPEGDNPTHYVSGWANIPEATRTAVLAAGAVEHDDLAAAFAAINYRTPNAKADALDALAAIQEASDLATDRAQAVINRQLAAIERGE